MKLSMFKGVSLVLICLIFTQAILAQKRFKQTVFAGIDSIENIQYGEAINVKDQAEKLFLTFFQPAGDTMKRRPIVIFIHGGGFVNGSRFGGYGARFCNEFTKRGYVTASIEYRLGIASTKTNNDYAEAMYRAQQDGRAAVRYFRRYAEKYGIDTSQIFIAGSSAGSMTCLSMAYMNENEIPKGIDQSKWGSLEGSSGNEGYSSKVHGVLNAWGSMIDNKWIQKGDAPLFNYAGTADKTVPYDSSYSYHGLGDGPYITYQRCLQVGVPTGWRPFYGAGHSLDSQKPRIDSAIQSVSDWLYTQLRYIYTSNPREYVFKWEKDIKAFDSLNAVEKHGKKAILFVGSSYIRLWENIREDLKQKDIIHRGYGGSNMTDLAYYVKRIVYPHEPAAIFMYVGNDIVASEKDKSPDQVLELFKYVVKVIREKYPTIPITWLQVSPSEKRWAVWDKVQEANKLIDDYCKQQSGLYTISVADKFLSPEGKPITSLYRDDKLHYNIEGYHLWGDAIRAEVKRIIKEGGVK
jgi:acetyl esterase/lipase/lysophospholipase L1-like esterase